MIFAERGWTAGRPFGLALMLQPKSMDLPAVFQPNAGQSGWCTAATRADRGL